MNKNDIFNFIDFFSLWTRARLDIEKNFSFLLTLFIIFLSFSISVHIFHHFICFVVCEAATWQTACLLDKKYG